ncbi:general odorant-binding protein 72-like [Lutzomyia longipalpis]|uniref:general odorant-binding protein 72-like n=1 Tax=Lutzomyia longipalpis TaxID=7200 RepID=UPI002483808F|nr:general odorant-binding protein 72-like [Lutzomyia longipalpis]
MCGKLVLSLGLLAIFVTISVEAVSFEDAKQLATYFSEPCRRKYRVSNEIIESVNKGNFPEDRELKCYANCMLEATGTVSRGRINYRMTIQQIDLFFPEEMKDPAKKTVDACRGSVKGFKDYCDASYSYVQCMYKNNRKYFYFP